MAGGQVRREQGASPEPNPQAGTPALHTLLRFLVLLALVYSPLASFAQVPSPDTGSVAGTVSDSWNGKGLSGATITVRGFTFATQTDPLGSYKLSGVTPGNHILQFTKGGYVKVLVENVKIAAGQTTRADVQLKPDFFLLETYEVMAEPFQAQQVEILETRQKASVLMEALGSEQMSQRGVSDAAEALTKVTGATLVDGKFAVIRGLSDRYTSATLNSAEIPSADPYHKSAQLDLFPAAMIERVAVSKTFTPDLPGGFTGGTINIITKSFPDKFFFSFSYGGSYNTQSSLNDNFLNYQGGAYDWAGMDDGTRALPSVLENVTTFPSPNTGPVGQRQAKADELAALGRSFQTAQMGPSKGTAPLNQNFGLSVGDTVKLFDRRFGYFTALSYDRKFNFYENGIQKRFYANNAQPTIYQDFKDTKATEEASWSGLVNLAYELTEGQELAFNFLYNQTAEDESRVRTGKLLNLGQLPDGSSPAANPDDNTHLNTLHYTERNLTAFQLKGRHELPLPWLVKLDWLASLAGTTQDEPDLRYMNFISVPNPADPTGRTRNLIIGDASLPQPSLPTRYFRALEENNENAKVDLTVPYEQWSGLDGEVKTGVYYSSSRRTFEERTFSFDGNRNFIDDPEAFPLHYLDPANLGYTKSGNFYTFSRSINSQLGNNKYEGSQDIRAAYLMNELPLCEKLRLIGGARFETTDLQIESTAFNQTGTFKGQIKNQDWLPAAGLVFNLTSNMNVRAAWSKTLARPTYREFASYRSYDVTGDEIVQGNTNLVRTLSENYDLRWEWFPRPGEVLSVGGFYKLLTSPIEKISVDRLGDIVTFTNQPQATVFGAEFEARKKLDFIDSLLEPFSVGLNFAWIASEVDNPPKVVADKLASTGKTEKTRPLFDQSPYVLNADLSYANPKSGTSVSLIFNQAGERLYLVNQAGYNVYEQPAPQLDFILSQKLGKHWKLKFSAKNLLDPDYKRIYGQRGELAGDPVYSSHRKGLTFGLSMNCEF